jgi:hypothetical protein
MRSGVRRRPAWRSGHSTAARSGGWKAASATEGRAVDVGGGSPGICEQGPPVPGGQMFDHQGSIPSKSAIASGRVALLPHVPCRDAHTDVGGRRGGPVPRRTSLHPPNHGCYGTDLSIDTAMSLYPDGPPPPDAVAGRASTQPPQPGSDRAVSPGSRRRAERARPGTQ